MRKLLHLCIVAVGGDLFIVHDFAPFGDIGTVLRHIHLPHARLFVVLCQLDVVCYTVVVDCFFVFKAGAKAFIPYHQRQAQIQCVHKVKLPKVIKQGVPVTVKPQIFTDGIIEHIQVAFAVKQLFAEIDTGAVDAPQSNPVPVRYRSRYHIEPVAQRHFFAQDGVGRLKIPQLVGTGASKTLTVAAGPLQISIKHRCTIVCKCHRRAIGEAPAALSGVFKGKGACSIVPHLMQPDVAGNVRQL